MTDREIHDPLEELHKEEIRFIQSSETGRLYFNKRFDGKLPAPQEYIEAYGVAVYPLIRWLCESGKDKEFKSCVQRIAKGNNTATARLIEEIAILRDLLPHETRWVNRFQKDREKLAKEHSKKKKRVFEKYKKMILETAEITCHIDVEKALADAQRKTEEIPPPPYLNSASESLKHGFIWPNMKMKQSSTGRESLRRFICVAYRIAKTQTTASDNSIFENIAATLNMMAVKGDTQFTNKNIQSYVRRHCTE